MANSLASSQVISCLALTHIFTNANFVLEKFTLSVNKNKFYNPDKTILVKVYLLG